MNRFNVRCLADLTTQEPISTCDLTTQEPPRTCLEERTNTMNEEFRTLRSNPTDKFHIEVSCLYEIKCPYVRPTELESRVYILEQEVQTLKNQLGYVWTELRDSGKEIDEEFLKDYAERDWTQHQD